MLREGIQLASKHLLELALVSCDGSYLGFNYTWEDPGVFGAKVIEHIIQLCAYFQFEKERRCFF